MEKNCKSCERTLPISEFYKHPKMADGHQSICKECQKLISRKTRRSRLEYYRAYDSKRGKLPHRLELAAKISKRRRKEAVNYQKCHNAVKRALDTGKITRLPCQMCGTTGWVLAHHDSYENPLDVMWLCPPHHKARHAFLDWLNAVDG